MHDDKLKIFNNYIKDYTLIKLVISIKANKDIYY